MLRDPEAMYPGRRRMQQYDFTDQQISDLIAFFEWVDANGDGQAKSLDYVPLPDALVQQIEGYWSKELKY